MNISKLINDTLKTPGGGKWSRKSLTMLVSFLMAVIIGSYITISDYFIDGEINRYAIDVFFGFLALAGGTSILTVWDKIKKRREKNQQGIDNGYEEDYEKYPEA